MEPMRARFGNERIIVVAWWRNDNGITRYLCIHGDGRTVWREVGTVTIECAAHHWYIVGGRVIA